MFNFYSGEGKFSKTIPPTGLVGAEDSIWETNTETVWLNRAYTSTELAGCNEFRDDEFYLEVRSEGENWIKLERGDILTIEWTLDELEVGGDFIDNLSCSIDFLIHFNYKPTGDFATGQYSEDFISQRRFLHVITDEDIRGTKYKYGYEATMDMDIIALEGRVLFDGAANPDSKFTSHTVIRAKVYKNDELVIR